MLAIGEAHALRGTEKVEPTARRFTRDLLPLLRGRASDLVVELLLPNARCEPATRAARKEQKVVTDTQAPTDQNDYVALGNAARSLGILPHALEPSCDDLARIGTAGRDAIATSLDVVTRLSSELLGRLADRNAATKDPRMVVAYGGAMHNDVAPAPGRAAWSFGPALGARTGGRYVELDLIVPEFIADTPAWNGLPWLPAYRAAPRDDVVTLLTLSDASYVIVFARKADGTSRR